MNKKLLDPPKSTRGVYFSEALKAAVQERADRMQRKFNKVVEMSIFCGLPLAFEPHDQHEALTAFLTLLANPDQVRKISLEARAILALALLEAPAESEPTAEQAEWLGGVGNYVVDEGYLPRHLDALAKIVYGLNWNKDTEKIVFDCAASVLQMIQEEASDVHS